MTTVALNKPLRIRAAALEQGAAKQSSHADFNAVWFTARPGFQGSSRGPVTTISNASLAVSSPAVQHTPSLSDDSSALPPTPVFPSSSAMASFLHAYSRMLQHVSAKTSSALVHETTAVSGDALASVGLTLLERLHIGLMALMGHPVHGIRGGKRWHLQEQELEKCLDELETDIRAMASAHEKVPSDTTLLLAAMHCNHAANLVSKL